MICLGPTICNTIMNNDIDGIGNLICDAKTFLVSAKIVLDT